MKSLPMLADQLTPRSIATTPEVDALLAENAPPVTLMNAVKVEQTRRALAKSGAEGVPFIHLCERE